MGLVAEMLSNPNTNLERPVVDKTGLTGAYTMQFEFQSARRALRGPRLRSTSSRRRCLRHYGSSGG